MGTTRGSPVQSAMNVIVPVPGELQRILKALHHRHWPPPHDRYNPHLTVKMPFRVSGRFDDVIARIDAAIGDFGPFHVLVRGVEASRSKTPWLHVVVRNPAILRALHRSVYDTLRDVVADETPYLRWFEGARYTPHISLGPARDLADPAAVLAALQQEDLVYRFRVRTLHLDRRDADGRWQTAHTFLLAGSARTRQEASAPPAN